MTPPGFTWTDIHDIAAALAEHYPQHNPMTIRFTELKKLVETLPGFYSPPGKACNEKILEAIQMAWLQELQNRRDEQED